MKGQASKASRQPNTKLLMKEHQERCSNKPANPEIFQPIQSWLEEGILSVAVEASTDGKGALIYARKGETIIPLTQRTRPGRCFADVGIQPGIQKLTLKEGADSHQKEPIRDDKDAQHGLTPGASVRTRLDMLKQATTIHIVAPKNHSSSTIIEVCQEIKVISDNHVFEALIACDGTEATLEIEVQAHAPHLQRRIYTTRIEKRYKGGPNLSSHKHVRIPIGINAEIASIRLFVKEIESIGHEKPSKGPSFYITNPVLKPARGRAGSQKKTQPRSTEFAKRTGTPQNSLLLYAGIAGSFNSPTDDGIQLHYQENHKLTLFYPENNEVYLEQDWGHVIQVRAKYQASFVLYINNEACKVLQISKEKTQIDLPAHWLRGEPIMLQIRDNSGSQIFLSHPMLAPRHLTPQDALLRDTSRPFPTDLTTRSNYRYQALRRHISSPIKGISQAVLMQALETLDGDYSTVRLSPLSFPIIESPKASIVIPAHNKLEVTYYALCALLLAHNTESFEVILVDDCSTDKTAEIEQLVSGIQVIRTEQPVRFIQACNIGAMEARGQYLVLLNNDTEVTVGWLDALVDAFHRFDDVGAVGAKLLYPDGTIQDAGGIVWGSGNPWNYGNRENPWEPRFCYSRQVDYLSGAALMTTKAIWDQVGGLSSYLEPMYFEDTDFAYKVRKAGYKTIFVPSSIVYHFEGATSGVDTTSGFKRYQEINRPKFKRCWAKEFAGNGEEGVKPDLEKDRRIAGRILFIDYTTPREKMDAGSYAAIREIKIVQSLGYKVTFLPQNLAFFGNHTEELQRMGVEVITAPFFRSLGEFLKKRAKEFNAAYITRYHVAAEVLHLIREHSPKTQIILNNADLHFLRELRAAMRENNDGRWQEISDIRKQEMTVIQNVDLVLSYNEVEHAVISSHADGQVKVMTCPWVVELPDTVAELGGRRGLSFLGNFKHHPNTEGVQWFCREVMPLLKTYQLRLSIYGSSIDSKIQDLASEWIDPVGYIEDLSNAYELHRVFVAPLLSGAGIKGKVLNALAYGTPMVLTPTAAEGIGLRHGLDCLIATTPDEWVRAITRLCVDDSLWNSISKAARSYAANQFSFEAGKAKMRAAFEAIDIFGHTNGL